MDVLQRDPTFPEQMATVLTKALTSSTWFYDKKAGKVEERADTRSQLEAIKLIMAYAEGLPLQRILEHKITEQRSSVHEALRESPELLAAVEREVEKAKHNGRHKKPRAAVEIDLP